jgi:hypothetical protein
MDAKLQTFLCLAGGGGFFAVLGGLFGAVAGALYWRSGRAAGTTFGLSVARAFDRVSDKELSPGVRGAITGAADGILFLGTLGLVAGGFVAYGGWVDPSWLGRAAGLALALVAAAMLFGLLAYAMVRAGVRVLAPAAGCGLLGAVSGAWLSGVWGLMVGLIVGVLVGTTVLSWLGDEAPSDRP